MINNQFARRNLPVYERARLALRLKPLIAEKAKEQQVRMNENRVRQISDKQAIETKKELVKAAGVSHDTIAKVEKIEAKASPEIKQKLASGEMSIYQHIKYLMSRNILLPCFSSHRLPEGAGENMKSLLSGRLLERQLKTSLQLR